ncbi:MAG TPA: cell division protein FtsQ/DivIB [Solirubrobacterales bacterium]|nr:cell division protein FtsQ/DivIB [Solirubrobacterales bacterium]HMU27964.1 cell division protein FtsQ/DivIB [Solirubrobacterales bacterium]HMY26995.1 cell division protein FtsQ/DivIB [Solirubrobacterales bacterium]HNA45371.1 cell division protein FtsQ/DivIB [Solirubrobacterales bacterium]
MSRSSRNGSPVARTSELAMKRERRSNRFRLILFFGLILILVLAAAYQFWLRDSSFVEIRKLEVAGVSTGTEEGKQIDQAIRTAMGEMTTLHVQPAILEQELDRFPRVADAQIETSFPDSATVTVKVRENGSIYGEGSEALLIATDGTVLGPADGQEESLPLISDGDPPAGAESANGSGSTGDVLAGRALNQALVLGATPSELRPYVTESRATADGVRVYMEDGLILLFGDPSHADQKWRAAAALIADPSFDTSSYVDLTVPRRPGVSAEAPIPETPDQVAAGDQSEPVSG